MPRLHKYIRFAFLASLQLLTLGEKVAQGTQVALPPECKGLDLVRGDPSSAKTILFGENHFGDQACYDKMRTCAEALTKDVPRNQKIALLEGIPAGAQSVYSDEPARGLDTIFDECSGWDLPQREFDQVTKPMHDQHVYNELYQNFDKALTENPNMDAPTFLKKLGDLTDHFTADLNKEAQAQQAKFDKYKKTHPKADQTKFFVSHNKEQTRIKSTLKTLKALTSQVKQGVPFKKAINSEVTKKLKNAVKETAEELSNPTNVFGTRNKKLVQSTKKARQKNDKVVAFVGKFHFRPDSDAKRKQQENQQRIAQELLDALDPRENAVISCP